LLKKLFSNILWEAYKKYEPYYFPLISKAPEFLNYAYPDFSVQYFINIFIKNVNITLKGLILN